MTVDTFAARTVTAWLGYVHAHAKEAALPGVINLATPIDEQHWRSRCYRLDELDQAGAAAVANSDHGRNIYYRTHLLAEPVETYKRGTSDQTRWVTHISADVDIAGPGHKPPEGKVLPTATEAVALIDATLAPSAIIASGGGYYPIWRLTEPYEIVTPADRDRYRDVGNRLDAALGSHGFDVDATALDLARVIRPPGVDNRKPGRDVRPVTVARGWVDGAGDYTVADLEHVLPTIAPKTVKPKPTGARVSTGKAPWEIFASRYDVDDVLAADPVQQWEDVGTRGGMRAWRYVGSANDYSIKEGDNAIIVWSGTIADRLGIKPGTGVDLWGFACRLADLDPTDAAKGRRP